VKQPWSELIARGAKTLDLRTWTTAYRGPLLIVASLAFDRRGRHHGVDGPRGAAVCVVELVDVRPATALDADAACITLPSWEGVLAWILTDPRRVASTPIRGRLGLFTPPPLPA
jgi:hypothetical protein